MNYKPEESELIAYLYGELSGDEKKRVEEYLSGNDQAMKELEALQGTRMIFGNIHDKEVDIPTFTFNEPSRIVVGAGGQSGFWKKPLAIAASIAIILFVGYLTRFQVSIGDEGFQVAFGEVENDYSPQEVEAMIASAIAKNNDEFDRRLMSTEAGMKHMVDDKNQALKAQLARQTNNSSFEEVTLDKQRQQFFETFRKMLEKSELDQKKYTDEVLTDFAIYLDVQRQSDLDIIQTQFNSLQDNAELNQLQTNEILSTLISSKEQPNLNQY